MSTIWAVLFAVGTGLLANECCDLAPWCARKLVRWSAFHRYGSSARAESRAEELAAVINDRPGNLLKLITALAFAVGAALISVRPLLARHAGSGQQMGSLPTTPRATIEEVQLTELTITGDTLIMIGEHKVRLSNGNMFRYPVKMPVTVVSGDVGRLIPHAPRDRRIPPPDAAGQTE